MKKYRVQWAEAAGKDLESVVEYIAQENIQIAIKIFDKIRSSVSTLEKMPQRGRIVPELQKHGIDIYREIIVVSWRIIYRISGLNVYVFAAIDSRRNVEDILLDRLINHNS
jgi:plasmid stabilization system protein ParE